MPKVPKIRSLHIYAISPEKHGLKWFFCLQINTKVFYKGIVFWMCVSRLAQITQNNKFAISLPYLKKKMSHEVDFLHADKHESFLQIDTIIFDGMVKFSQSSQDYKFAMSLQYLEVRDEVDSLHADKHQSFLQVNFNTLSIKVFYQVILSLLMGMINQSQST